MCSRAPLPAFQCGPARKRWQRGLEASARTRGRPDSLKGSLRSSSEKTERLIPVILLLWPRWSRMPPTPKASSLLRVDVAFHNVPPIMTPGPQLRGFTRLRRVADYVQRLCHIQCFQRPCCGRSLGVQASIHLKLVDFPAMTHDQR